MADANSKLADLVKNLSLPEMRGLLGELHRLIDAKLASERENLLNVIRKAKEDAGIDLTADEIVKALGKGSGVYRKPTASRNKSGIPVGTTLTNPADGETWTKSGGGGKPPKWANEVWAAQQGK